MLLDIFPLQGKLKNYRYFLGTASVVANYLVTC